jgi:hypothetical protein
LHIIQGEVKRQLDGGGLWADHVLGVWVYIRFFCDGGLRFRPYGESPFPNAEKVTEKALLLRSARSLGLGVPSLRD